MKLTRILFFLLFVILYHQADAQQGESIKVSPDKNKILIGEPLQLTVELTGPAKSNLVIPAFDSIDHFEFLQPVLMDSVFGAGNKTIKMIYTFTSFDSGSWVLPPIEINPKLKTEPVTVDVIFSAFNPEQDYHEIKDIIEVKPKEEKRNWLWYVIAAAAVAAVVIYYFTRKKKQPTPAATPPVLNACEEALKQLAELQKHSLQGKEFHTRLVDIFKLYVLRKKNIRSLQKTTDDLVVQLKNAVTDKDLYAEMQQALRLSDFVKFAKYIPSAGDDNEAFNSIKKAILSIEKGN